MENIVFTALFSGMLLFVDRVASWARAGRVRCPKDSLNLSPFHSAVESSVLRVGTCSCLRHCWSGGHGAGEAESLLFINTAQIFEEYYLAGTLYCFVCDCISVWPNAMFLEI